jgi:pimeloyl-ACP methyl ester carboxylesterase
MIREGRGASGLSWSEAGDPRGLVVVYFHGTTKEREPFPFSDVAERLGIRLLMADRPGYGGSAPNSHASLSDVGRMVLGDLDDEGVDRFSVLGWSGGGPHALGCAAVAQSRVRAVGLIASWAPMNPPDRGLPVGVRFAMEAAARLPRPAIRSMFLLGRHSSAGMVDDVRRVARPWGFGVERVASAVRVVAWHAEGDRQVPLAPWRALDGIELTVVSGDSHDVSSDLWEVALRRVAIDEPQALS